MKNNIIKKSLLAFGSAFALTAGYAHAGVEVEDMSFGICAGASLSPAIVSGSSSGKTYEGRLKMSPIGSAFFTYRATEDVSMGLDVGYVNNGLNMAPASPSENDDYSLNVHSLQVSLPVHWLPMEREGGLSLGLKFSTLISLYTTQKMIDGAGNTSLPNNDIAQKYNPGAGLNFMYEIDESGFILFGEYIHFFLHHLDKKSAGAINWAKSLDVDLEKQNRLQFIQFGLGYDFARLMLE